MLPAPTNAIDPINPAELLIAGLCADRVAHSTSACC